MSQPYALHAIAILTLCVSPLLGSGARAEPFQVETVPAAEAWREGRLAPLRLRIEGTRPSMLLVRCDSEHEKFHLATYDRSGLMYYAGPSVAEFLERRRPMKLSCRAWAERDLIATWKQELPASPAKMFDYSLTAGGWSDCEGGRCLTVRLDRKGAGANHRDVDIQCWLKTAVPRIDFFPKEFWNLAPSQYQDRRNRAVAKARSIEILPFRAVRVPSQVHCALRDMEDERATNNEFRLDIPGPPAAKRSSTLRVRLHKEATYSAPSRGCCSPGYAGHTLRASVENRGTREETIAVACQDPEGRNWFAGVSNRLAPGTKGEIGLGRLHTPLSDGVNFGGGRKTFSCRAITWNELNRDVPKAVEFSGRVLVPHPGGVLAPGMEPGAK